jgi:hypothetical protein
VREIFRDTPGVVDVDWYVEDAQPKRRFVIDKEKAALHGISAEISRTLRIAVAGEPADLLHIPGEKEDVAIVVQLPRSRQVLARGPARPARASGDGNALPEPGTSRRTRARWSRCASWCASRPPPRSAAITTRT